MLIDHFQRKHTYLRLAVTDRCNLRCRYCMPEEGIAFAPREQLLTYEEMLRLTALLKVHGLEKVRLTGGEPLARKGIEVLFRGLADQGLRIHLTTNGWLLERFLPLLSSISVKGINISLDSLRSDRFQAITRRDAFPMVWRSLEMALEAGLRVKINMVLMAGVNDDEIFDFALLARDRPLDIRFIEAMPFNAGDGNRSVFIAANDIERRLRGYFPAIQQTQVDPHSAALQYSMPAWLGSIGIIPAYSRSLCGQCNRIRLTPKGTLLNCLYAREGLELLPLLRRGIADDELIELISDYLKTKAVDGHTTEKLAARSGAFESMTTIGG
ncbi:MAG: GTP 3',8-cyclase MoaA [Bacteroidota bacterium]